jgi:signal transduction histidine kinase
VERRELPDIEDAEEVVNLIKEADAHARRLARGLAPVELDQGGLAAALERLADNAEPLFDIRCTVEMIGDEVDVLPSTVAMHLFRIAQEALSNAVRHGRAKRVSITQAHGSDQLRLRVQDDGRGIHSVLRTGGTEILDTETVAAESVDPGVSAPVRPEDNRGMGIRIMHYRARVIGGRLEIRPGTERGTIVTCTVPLTHRTPTDFTPETLSP